MSAHTEGEERKRILVAEDEVDLREALFTVLAAEGYEVFTASDGKEALEIAKREQPDLVLLDLVMPHMSGQEMLAALKSEEWGVNMKVIILTALDDMQTLSETLEKGGYDYLVKSDWRLEDIVKKVREELVANDLNI